MKNMKKGFTIVELVIVIAVIAILAAVLIPTFSGVIQKTQQSAALQVATSTMKSTLAMSDYGTIAKDTVFVVDAYGENGYLFTYKQNKINAETFSTSFVSYGASTMNSIIVNKDNLNLTGATPNFLNDAKDIVKDAIGEGAFAPAASDKNYAATYTFTVPAVKYTEASAKAYNATLTGAYTTETVKTPAVNYTQEEIGAAQEGDAAYGKTTSDVKTPAVYYTQAEADAYNATISGAKTTDDIEVASYDNVWYVFTNTDYAKNVVTFTYSKIAVAD